MKKFEVQFYEKRNGDVPVEQFLNSLDMKMRAKLVGIISILQDYGNQLREPYSKIIEDGIYEIRGQVGNNITRVLYFFYCDGKIILTNGFIKKSQKTPREEIEKAKKYRNDYIERCKSDEKV